MDAIDRLLKPLGVRSVSQLARSHLIIHVIFGGEQEKGQTYVVECGRLQLSDGRITIDFEDRPIAVRFDEAALGKKMGGEFEGEDSQFSFEILCLEYSRAGWGATYEASGQTGSFFSDNLQVEVLL